jgi:hypothetical protein
MRHTGFPISIRNAIGAKQIRRISEFRDGTEMAARQLMLPGRSALVAVAVASIRTVPSIVAAISATVPTTIVDARRVGEANRVPAAVAIIGSIPMAAISSIPVSPMPIATRTVVAMIVIVAIPVLRLGRAACEAGP